MRRYTISVNDTSKVIDVEAIGENSFRVQIDGRTVDVRLEDHRDLAHSAITPELTTQPSYTHGHASGGGPPAPESPTRPATPSSEASAPAGTGAKPTARDRMTAPMPGAILSIEVAVGETVSRGDTVMVLEAMKMNNALRAPKDGVIAEIYVAPGDSVRFGQKLLRFE